MVLKKSHVSLLVTGLLFVCGCEMPVVPICHYFQPAVAPGVGVGPYHVGEFDVVPDNGDGYGVHFKELLKETVEHSTKPPAYYRDQADIFIDGEIRIHTEDLKTTRRIRSWSEQSTSYEIQEVPSRVLAIDIDVDIVLRNEREGSEPVVVELSKSYRSSQDYLVRGELGLQRADDPSQIPDDRLIVQLLLHKCCFDAIELLCSPQEYAPVRLWPAKGVLAREGFDAVESHDFEKAGDSFVRALSERPGDVNLLFNLAVVQEAQGMLEEAMENYRRLADILEEPDDQVDQALVRIEKVQARRAYDQQVGKGI